MEPPVLNSRIFRPTAFNRNHAAIKLIFTIFLNSLSANSRWSCIFPVKSDSLSRNSNTWIIKYHNTSINLLLYLRKRSSWQTHPISPKSGTLYPRNDGKSIRFDPPCPIQRPARCLCLRGRGNPWFCSRCSAGNSDLPAKPTWINHPSTNYKFIIQEITNGKWLEAGEFHLHPCFTKWKAMPWEMSSPLEVSNTLFPDFSILLLRLLRQPLSTFFPLFQHLFILMGSGVDSNDLFSFHYVIFMGKIGNTNILHHLIMWFFLGFC